MWKWGGEAIKPLWEKGEGSLAGRKTSQSWLLPATAAKSLQSCPTLWSHIRQPTRLPRPWDSPGKNTGVGCHFLQQCVKVKSESEVAQSCLTLSDPLDCSLPGSSVHGIFQARVLEWGATAFSGLLPRLMHKIRFSDWNLSTIFRLKTYILNFKNPWHISGFKPMFACFLSKS